MEKQGEQGNKTNKMGSNEGNVQGDCLDKGYLFSVTMHDHKHKDVIAVAAT